MKPVSPCAWALLDAPAFKPISSISVAVFLTIGAPILDTQPLSFEFKIFSCYTNGLHSIAESHWCHWWCQHRPISKRGLITVMSLYTDTPLPTSFNPRKMRFCRASSKSVAVVNTIRGVISAPLPEVNFFCSFDMKIAACHGSYPGWAIACCFAIPLSSKYIPAALRVVFTSATTMVANANY